MNCVFIKSAKLYLGSRGTEGNAGVRASCWLRPKPKTWYWPIRQVVRSIGGSVNVDSSIFLAISAWGDLPRKRGSRAGENVAACRVLIILLSVVSHQYTSGNLSFYFLIMNWYWTSLISFFLFLFFFFWIFYFAFCLGCFLSTLRIPWLLDGTWLTPWRESGKRIKCDRGNRNSGGGAAAFHPSTEGSGTCLVLDQTHPKCNVEPQVCLLCFFPQSIPTVYLWRQTRIKIKTREVFHNQIYWI